MADRPQNRERRGSITWNRIALRRNRNGNWAGQILQCRSRIWLHRDRRRRFRCLRSYHCRRGRMHEDTGSRPIGRIRSRPRAGWPLKGCPSSFALTLFSPPAPRGCRHRFLARRRVAVGRRAVLVVDESERPQPWLADRRCHRLHDPDRPRRRRSTSKSSFHSPDRARGVTQSSARAS